MNLTLYTMITFLASLATLMFAVGGTVAMLVREATHKGDALYKKNPPFTRFQFFFFFFAIATAIIFLPIYAVDYFGNEEIVSRIIKTLSLSIHNTMRLFILDGDFEIIASFVGDGSRINSVVGTIFSTYSALLFVSAPILTAGVVLSFVKNVGAAVRYTLSPAKNVYYISELNEKSIALATDIVSQSIKSKESALVVFFDVFDGGEASTELIAQARRIGAICLQKDITDIGIKHVFCKKRKFYLIGEDMDENLKQSLALINYCRSDKRFNRPSTEFYVFATTAESEVLLDAVDNGSMRVRRVNEKRNLVTNALLTLPIYENPVINNGEKCVNFLIVGSGNYGIEILRALCWCSQIPGYRAVIHIVGKEKNIEDGFRGIAPELVERNGVVEAGEPFYDIHFYSELDVFSGTFVDALGKMGEITTAFVALGDDELNVSVAMKLRSEFARLKIKEGRPYPDIYSVVYSTLKAESFSFGLTGEGIHREGEEAPEFPVHFIGDMRTMYSLETIEHEQLEKDGARVHLGWSDTPEMESVEFNYSSLTPEQRESIDSTYNKVEYYRRASIARAVHIRVLSRLGISFGGNVELGMYWEHMRWNTYMRSEGYIKGEKNHVAKMHQNLVPNEELSYEDAIKDINISLELGTGV